MSVTVGVATTGDNVPMLRRAVAAARRSADYVGGEVLVVVNGGARVQLAGARVLYQADRNVAAARNLILDAARGDTVLFTDDDCLVPPDWCATMATALADRTVVTAPVRMLVAGPVSAFFEYQRLFDASPAGGDRPPLVVTANCGVRRDRLPEGLRFDPALSSAGEDTHFGLRLADAGVAVTHLDDAAPVRHGLSESITELSGRFLRNARGGARLFLEYGRGEAAQPDALTYYRLRTAPDFPLERRFGEVADPRARAAFAAFDSISANVSLLGYLDTLGTLLDHPLVRLDPVALEAEWDRIGSVIAELTAGISAAGWAGLDIDCRRIGDPVASHPLQDEVRAALRRHAPPIAADPTGAVADVLAHAGPARFAAFAADQALVRDAWGRLRREDGPVRPDAANRVARSLGLSFRVAGDIAEVLTAIDASAARRRAGARR